MVYSHKPQRSGKSQPTNTNNPPQDPPPPPKSMDKIIEDAEPYPEFQIPDIPIQDTTPPVPEVCTHESHSLPKPVKKITPKKVIPIPEKKIAPKKPVIEKPQIKRIILRTRITSFLRKLFGKNN